MESLETLTFHANKDYNPESSEIKGGDLCMKGKVKTREKCPACRKSFLNIPETDIFCSDCNTRPKSYYIFFYHNKEKYRISRDTDGHILDSYKRAHRLLENIRKDIDDGIFYIDDYITKEIEQFRIKNLLDKWIEAKQSQDLSPGHIKGVKRYAMTYYREYFGNMLARDIRTFHIENFLSWLPNHLSTKTKKNIMIMLKNFCYWLNRLEILIRMPQFPNLIPEEPAVTWISKEDQLTILDNIPEHHKPIFKFMMYHPVRPGEARALKVKHFDLENMNVLVSKTWSLHTIRQRKGRKPYYLPLSKHFDEDLLNNNLPSAFVFTNQFGRPYTDTRLRKIWNKAREKAGIRHISMYPGLRHSIASQAINSGIGLDMVSKALGHSTIETTKKYASLNTKMLQPIVDGGAQMVHISKNENRKYLKNKVK